MNRRTFVTRSIFAAMALSLLLGLPASPARASEEDALRAKWATMPQEKKDLLLQRWKEFQSLSKEEQEKLWAALARFQALPSDVQERIQRNYERWKKYSPEQKTAVRKHFQEFQAMPAGDQESLRGQVKDAGSAK